MKIAIKVIIYLFVLELAAALARFASKIWGTDFWTNFVIITAGIYGFAVLIKSHIMEKNSDER